MSLAHFQQYPPEPFTLADLGDEAHQLTGLAKVLQEARGDA